MRVELAGERPEAECVALVSFGLRQGRRPQRSLQPGEIAFGCGKDVGDLNEGRIAPAKIYEDGPVPAGKFCEVACAGGSTIAHSASGRFGR